MINDEISNRAANIEVHVAKATLKEILKQIQRLRAKAKQHGGLDNLIKHEGKEMKLAALCIIIHPLLILGFSAIAVACQAGLEGITNPGYHGLSQVLYEFASSAANNGSGFEGLADNSYFWNITTGMAMFFGRYLSIIIQLAIAGSLFNKMDINESVGTLKTNTWTFSIVLVFVVYIFAALTFLPSLALGPIAEALTIGI